MAESTAVSVRPRGQRAAHGKIEVDNVSVTFGSRTQEAQELLAAGESKDGILRGTECTVGVSGASFAVAQGEVFVIMGLSGSGKSTRLRCLNRLIEPTSGTVTIGDHEVTAAGTEELRRIPCTGTRMISQHFGLLPHRSVVSNVAFGLEIQGAEQVAREARALETIHTVGLDGTRT